MSLPIVPPLNDHRLAAFLESLRSSLLKADSETTGTDSEGTTGTTNNSLPFAFVYETPAVLAGTGEPEDTEDAWTTVPSGAPAGTEFAIIQFYMASVNDDAGGILSWRSQSGDAEIEAAIIQADGTSDNDRASIAAYHVPLVDGNFDYKADTTSGSLTWQVRRIGYIQ